MNENASAATLPPVLPTPRSFDGTTPEDTVPAGSPWAGAPTAPRPGRDRSRRGGKPFDALLAQLHRLPARNTDDSWFGGVCSGLAARTGLDLTLVRLVLALSVLVMGTGAGLYLVAWATMPDENGRIHLERALRGRGLRHKVLAVMALSVVVSALVPILVALDKVFLPAALIAAVVALVVTRKGARAHHV